MAKYTATINTGAYSIEWRSKKPFENYKPKIVEINFFDEKNEDDIIAPLTRSDVEFSIEAAGDGNQYNIYFSGTIEFELEPKQRRILKKEGYLVDYCVSFSGPDGDGASSGEEFELIENTSFTLENFKAL
jgi:hypothetical protein